MNNDLSNASDHLKKITEIANAKIPVISSDQFIRYYHTGSDPASARSNFSTHYGENYKAPSNYLKAHPVVDSRIRTASDCRKWIQQLHCDSVASLVADAIDEDALPPSSRYMKEFSFRNNDHYGYSNKVHRRYCAITKFGEALVRQRATMRFVQLIEYLQIGVPLAERVLFLSELFSDRHVVTVLFQSLAELEKVFVLRMLLLDRSIKVSLLSHWTVMSQPAVDGVIERLVRIGVFVDMSGGSIDLHANFRKTLVHAFAVDDRESSSTIQLSTASSVSTSSNQLYFFQKPPAIAAPLILGEDSKWHSLLERIIVGNALDGTAKSSFAADTDRIITKLGFGRTPPPPTAFAFVLGSTHQQLWTLVSEFVNLVGNGGLGLAATAIRIVVGVLVLSSSVGRRIDVLVNNTNLCNQTIQFLLDLDVLRPGPCIGPTAEALVNVASAGGGTAASLLVGCRLIIDSNMHITAYTKSEVQMKLVALFCQSQRIIGRVLMGIITRESIQRAIDGGVTAETILTFLSSNLHTVSESRLPNNVAMQIRLWESDCPRNRLKMEPAVVLTWTQGSSESAKATIASVTAVAKSYQGLLFVKTAEDGRVHVGIASEVAKNYILAGAK